MLSSTPNDVRTNNKVRFDTTTAALGRIEFRRLRDEYRRTRIACNRERIDRDRDYRPYDAICPRERINGLSPFT